MMSLSIRTFIVLLSIASVVYATKAPAKTLTDLFASQKRGGIPTKRCINLGTWYQAVGPFESELGLVTYKNPQPSFFSFPKLEINGTAFDRAFSTQRTAKLISFVFKLNPAFTYNVALGFSEVRPRACKLGARLMNLNVQGMSRFGVDVFRAVGCRRPYFVTFDNVKPGRLGFLSAFVRGINNEAQIAVACIERVTSALPPTLPPPAVPASTPTPTPTPSPSPSRSATPAPLPSPSPAVLKPSVCQQQDCFVFDGPGDYSVIGNSLSLDEDRENCRIRSSSSALLSIPAGAKVKRAILYWSASGELKKAAKATLNGVTYKAQKVYSGGHRKSQFYGAWADVTSAVQQNGAYNVRGIWYDNGRRYCLRNSAYAAWVIVVIYERADLPIARVNFCANDFTFTFPAGTYTNTVGCIAGTPNTTTARTTVVTFESDGYKGEFFYINGGFLGNNLFRGATAPNFDIRSFDVLNIVRSKMRFISYTIRSFFVQTRFGGAIEGLFMPIRVVYHTLD